MADCIYYASSFDFTTKSKKSKFVIDAFKNVKLFFFTFRYFFRQKKISYFCWKHGHFLIICEHILEYGEIVQ